MAAKSDGEAAAAGPGPEGVAGGARDGAGGRGEAAAVAGGSGVTGEGGPGPRYELRDCCWVLCALLVFFSDGATDLWLAASYYIQGQRIYFGLTLLFVLLPSLVVQLLSFRWFVYDYTEPAGAPGPAVSTKDSSAGGPVISTKDSAAAFRTKEGSPEVGSRPAPSLAGTYRRRCCRLCVWLLQTLVHLLQLGQVWRYLRTLYLGLQSRWRGERLQRHFYWRMLFESADVSMLRLLETFLRSAPQLVLQLSLIVHRSYGEGNSSEFQQLPGPLETPGPGYWTVLEPFSPTLALLLVPTPMSAQFESPPPDTLAPSWSPMSSSSPLLVSPHLIITPSSPPLPLPES